MSQDAGQYVVGFAFTQGMQSVVLIEKDHPQWQAGKFNGVGGHVEQGETRREAMAREFLEEAGVETNPMDWEVFLILTGREYSCTFLRLVDNEAAINAHTCTSEVICRRHPADVWHLPSVPNLRWIVPLAMDKDLEVPVMINDRDITSG